MKSEPSSRVRSESADKSRPRESRGEGSTSQGSDEILRIDSKLRRFRPLGVVSFAAGVAFAAWSFSNITFNTNATLTEILPGLALLTVFLGFVASPYLVIYVAAGNASSYTSKSVLAIGLLVIILYGAWAFSKADDHPEASLGFVIAPILQLAGSLPFVVVVRVIENLVSGRQNH